MQRVVTATELKRKLGQYLDEVEKQDGDILISKNGKLVAKLVYIDSEEDLVNSLIGILPPDVTADEAREGRLSKQ